MSISHARLLNYSYLSESNYQKEQYIMNTGTFKRLGQAHSSLTAQLADSRRRAVESLSQIRHQKEERVDVLKIKLKPLRLRAGVYLGAGASVAPRCGRGFHLRGALTASQKGASGRNLISKELISNVTSGRGVWTRSYLKNSIC